MVESHDYFHSFTAFLIQLALHTGHVLILRLQGQRIQLYVSTISNVSQIKVCTELQFIDLKLNHLSANYLGVVPYKLYQVNSPAPYQLLEYNPSTMNPFECKLSLFIPLYLIKTNECDNVKRKLKLFHVGALFILYVMHKEVQSGLRASYNSDHFFPLAHIAWLDFLKHGLLPTKLSLA
jgi:hypothetical protein